MMSDILLMHHVAIHGDEYFESLFDGLLSNSPFCIPAQPNNGTDFT